MIITRSPLRISLGGGGTDLPSYYLDHGGFVISAGIDKFVYVLIHQPFKEFIILKYSKLETVRDVDEIQHPLIREALKLIKPADPHLEIASMSDIPAGAGLGSSASFTTALLRALHALQRSHVSTRELAEEACHIELDILGEPIGKQDQYIAAFGGITCFHFERGGSVTVEPLRMDGETLHNLEDNLILFFTGYTRSASAILHDQDSRSRRQESAILDHLHVVKQIGLESKAALERGNLRLYAQLMHRHWEHKKQRSTGMSNSEIDEYYELALRNGALGGKLIGAGGGGCLMFYAEDKTRLRRALCEAGLREIRWRFDFQGTTVLSQI